MIFDPFSERMTFYTSQLYAFPPESITPVFIYDMTIDYDGNPWLFSADWLAKFDTASREFDVLQSPLGGAPGACDKQGNVYFVHWEYFVGLAGYSPSDQTSTEYWKTTEFASQIQDVAVDAEGKVWFIYTTVSGDALYRLSRGGVGLTVTSTTTFSSARASLTAIPSTMLVHTSSTAINTQTEKSTAPAFRSESILMPSSTTVLTETRVLDEFSAFTAVILLAAIFMKTLVRRRKRRGHDQK